MGNNKEIMDILLASKREGKVVKENKSKKSNKVIKEDLLSRRDMFLLCGDIAKRAEKLGLLAFDRISLIMDLEVAYDQYGLKLQELLNADDENFSHDIVGIQNHIDRNTKTIDPTFVPRYADNGKKVYEELDLKTDFLYNPDADILFYAKERVLPDKSNGTYYRFINYFDVWGNEQEGYEVNDSYVIGNVFIPYNATNEDIINFLGNNQYILHNPLLFDVEQLGESFNIVNKRTREPIFGFDPIVSADEVIKETVDLNTECSYCHNPAIFFGKNKKDGAEAYLCLRHSNMYGADFKGNIIKNSEEIIEESKIVKEDINNIPEKEFLDIDKDKEGLVFYGCGGDLQEWVDGITDILSNENIIKDKNWYEDVYYVTTTGGRTDLIFVFKEDLDISKFIIWRLKFGDCSWISDYIVNYAEQHGYDVCP